MSQVASQRAIVVDKGPVERALTSACTQDTSFLQNVQNVREQLLEITGIFVDAQEQDKATRLRQEYIELLNMEQEVKAHASVIEALRDSYAPSGVDPTDFKTFIDKAAAKELKKQKFDPLQSDALKKFDRSTKYQSGEQGEDDDDEGMMVEDSVLVNKLCPITMRPVLELTEPVEDRMGYVYERKAILQQLRNARGGPIACPVAGTSHTVLEAELRPSKLVARERRRQLFTQGTQATQGQTQRDGVIDVE